MHRLKGPAAMNKAIRTTIVTLLLIVLIGGAADAQLGQPTVVFEEDFSDASLPAWQGSQDARARLSATTGPHAMPAVSMATHDDVSSVLSVRLPVEEIAGKSVLLDVWRKAEDVRTGTRHYFNAKTLLSWKAKGAAKPQYSGDLFSGFSGTFDWLRHRYVVNMPEDLEWASVSIGMQECMGKASWAGLSVSVDPRFPTQASLERYLIEEQHKAFASLEAESLTVKRLDGGTIQVFADDQFVPRTFWNAAARQMVQKSTSFAITQTTASDTAFRSQIALAFHNRANELQAGLSQLAGAALNDRVHEIANLHERCRQIATGDVGNSTVRLKANRTAEAPVRPLVFGNNINTQNLSAPYDSSRGQFQEPFLERVRPMGITFLRYPGGCNADVFDWKDTIGPLEKRKDLINYHNGTSRGVPTFGVDEYLRFCEREEMTPIITTAFCKADPWSVAPNEHPEGIRHPFVISYLKTAPERVQLAADWVEYCNGSIDTPNGRLRAENGRPEPYNVKYWEIGNESYGPDPVGSCTAEEYAAVFPAYVRAMKARDPTIKIVMNGYSGGDWNDTILRLAGDYADALQFHIYHTPHLPFQKTTLEGQPHLLTDTMRSAETIPALLQEAEATMHRRLGRTLPTIISEFGMGNARDRELMTSVTSGVLVADMWRALIESPLIHGANKWCLFSGYWFSQIQGPTLEHPDAPYYNRPEHAIHTIYAECRGPIRLAVDNERSIGVKAVVFRRVDSYGVVLISREAVSWQSVVLDLPGARSARATCSLMTAGHPLLGNENDHALVRPYQFEFEYAPERPILVPSNSVMGLVVPR